MNRSMRRVPALALAIFLISLFTVGLTAGAAQADTFTPISGAGSTWSQNAIDQWRQNVQQYGLTVNYQGTGSTDGRNQFRSSTVDFGVSEIPYGTTDDGAVDSPPARPYAYMPIVAGGTSFMYNLKIGGQRVTQLRLSGDVVAKIFTNVITSWNDPAIQAENPGLVMPARRIVPVVRSDGSGTSAQFTLWMSKQYPAIWNAYCGQLGIASPCGQYSQYPVQPGTLMTAQSGSLGVSGYTAQDASEGAITYVEYSYALNANFPVVKLLNAAGYYNLPNATNVAVALLKAQINNDSTSPSYLTEVLDGVYNNPDPRTYPLSSYSYMIVPTSTDGSFSTDKGKSLGSFASYFLCEGQQSVASLGYSPLPQNLVQAGFAQIARIPGVDVGSIDLTKCDNPTFSANGTNTLATTAPQPQACDMAGPTQCGTAAVAAAASTAQGSSATTSGPKATGQTATSNKSGKSTTASHSAVGGASTSKAATSGSAVTGAAASGATSTVVGGAAAGTSAATTTNGAATGASSAVDPVTGAAVDPVTGAAVAAVDPATGLSTGAAATAASAPVGALAVNLAASSTTGMRTVLALVALGLIALVAILPPFIWQRSQRRSQS